MLLTSKNNPLIKDMVALKDKKGRREQGAFLVEGRKMAMECLRSDYEIEKVFVVEGYDGDLPFETEKIVYVSEDLLRHISDEKTPQGIVCKVKIPQNTLCAPMGSCLLLDGVADPGNVGTIIRTANAAGYNEVYLTQDSADPYSPKSVRASMSGVFFTKIYRAERAEILSVLSQIPLLVADMGGGNVFSFTPPKQYVLAIGNEANGISKEVFAQATHTIKIPMRATQESLNAAISAGIIMYVLKRDSLE